jgi:hypothetical protein
MEKDFTGWHKIKIYLQEKEVTASVSGTRGLVV